MAPITHIDFLNQRMSWNSWFNLVLQGSSWSCLKHLPDTVLALGGALEVGKVGGVLEVGEGLDTLRHCSSFFWLHKILLDCIWIIAGVLLLSTFLRCSSTILVNRERNTWGSHLCRTFHHLSKNRRNAWNSLRLSGPECPKLYFVLYFIRLATICDKINIHASQRRRERSSQRDPEGSRERATESNREPQRFSLALSDCMHTINILHIAWHMLSHSAQYILPEKWLKSKTSVFRLKNWNYSVWFICFQIYDQNAHHL